MNPFKAWKTTSTGTATVGSIVDLSGTAIMATNTVHGGLYPGSATTGTITTTGPFFPNAQLPMPLSMNFTVQKAANGFVIFCGAQQPYVAHNVEELQEAIVAILVAAKLK